MDESLIQEYKPKSNLPRFVWARLMVIGIVSFAIGGTSFLWSSRASYIASFFVRENSSMTVANLLILQSIQIFASNIGVAVGNTFKRLAGSMRNLFVLLAIVFAATSFPMCYINNFWWVALLRTVMGFAMGVAWYQPIGLAWATFPEKKGLIYGIFSAANFITLIGLSQITMWIVNPDNAKPEESGLFSVEVANNVPKMFNILGGIYVVTLFACAVCSFEQKRMGHLSNAEEMLNTPQLFEEDGTVAKSQRVTSFQAFQGTLPKRGLWILAVMLTFGMISPAILVNNFKVYGYEQGFDDLSLTLLFNILTAILPFQKLFTPVLAEKMGNRLLVVIVLVASIVNSVLLLVTNTNNIWYYGLISGISTLGYHTMWTVSVTYTSAEFPKETQPMIISLLGIFLSAGDIGSQSLIIAGLSFYTLFIVGLVLGAISLVMLFFLADGTILHGKALPSKNAVSFSVRASEISSDATAY